MVIVLLVISFMIAGFLMGFGDSGRGTYSKYISILAGFIWLCGVITSFLVKGVEFGLIAILTSFILASITSVLGKRLIIKLGKP